MSEVETTVGKGITEPVEMVKCTQPKDDVEVSSSSSSGEESSSDDSSDSSDDSSSSESSGSSESESESSDNSDKRLETKVLNDNAQKNMPVYLKNAAAKDKKLQEVSTKKKLLKENNWLPTLTRCRTKRMSLMKMQSR